MRDKYHFPIKICPHCGGRMIVIRQYIHGYGEYYVDLETGEVEATELHSNLQYRNTGKYAICVDCRKRLFKINEQLEVEE